MKVQIMIQDNREVEQNDLMGIKTDPKFELTDFWFRDELVESFWVDKKDSEIVFSLHGDDYRTPYSPKRFQQFIWIFDPPSSVGPPH